MKRLRVFRGDLARTIVRPWIRTPEWSQVSKVYRKEGGSWVEWWPLRPGQPTVVEGKFEYRNDRIELDIDWQAPATPPDIVRYDITVLIGTIKRYTFSQVGSATFTPDQAWQEWAGRSAIITVTAVGVYDDLSDPGVSDPVTVPQLPPPADPTSVDLDIVNRGGNATWAHVGGNTLSGFDLRTSYKGQTSPSTASAAARSKDVTFWSTATVAGDPGGEVGLLVRAVGPGGASNWVGSAGVVPNVPNPPPPPVVSLPGAPVIANHRFKNGVLECTYSVPNGVGVRVSLERDGLTPITLADQGGASGTITVPATSAYPRGDARRYRIRLTGYNSKNQNGPSTAGPWARKMFNPYYFVPNQFISMRGAYPDGEFYPFSPGYLMLLNLRQGSSYNVFAPFSPIINWRGYVAYDKAGKLSETYLGYKPTVSSGEVLIKRGPSGGLGGAVSPRLWWHGYKNLQSPGPGTSLFGSKDLPALARDQAAWLPLDTAYTRRLADQGDPGVQGVAVYHQNSALLSWLGNVSQEYMIFNGPFSTALGWPVWSIRVYHDG